MGRLLHRRSVRVAAVAVAALGSGVTIGALRQDVRGNQISAVVHEVWDASSGGDGTGPDYIRVHLHNSGPTVGNLKLVIRDDLGAVSTQNISSDQCSSVWSEVSLSTKPGVVLPIMTPYTLSCGTLGHDVTRDIKIRHDFGFEGEATVSVVGKPAATVRYTPDESSYAGSEIG